MSNLTPEQRQQYVDIISKTIANKNTTQDLQSLMRAKAHEQLKTSGITDEQLSYVRNKVSTAAGT